MTSQMVLVAIFMWVRGGNLNPITYKKLDSRYVLSITEKIKKYVAKKAGKELSHSKVA